tara:strand:- start:3072 stop:3518 length:447 start_codon:yes stop_codon:yes gene_type:complete
MEKIYHSGTLKKSIVVFTDSNKAWNILSKITDLEWLSGVKSSKFLSSKKRGIGASRRISFLDGVVVKEIVVGWRAKKYFSYIATSGLPLRAYHATISITIKNNKSVNINWQSFFASELMTKNEFDNFVELLTNFYSESLKNLKIILEK